MNKSLSAKYPLSLLAIALGIGQPSTGYGQELEEIIVTATKRAAGLQDIPIAVSVMDGEKISEQGVRSLGDLAVFMPNVQISETNSNNAIFIRGIGSGNNAGFEQSVGTFVDGVYLGRGQASRTAFLDLARVEVLKGPQSTLFGKNTVAGAINITSAKPTFDFEGKIEGSLEPEFNGWSTTLTLSGPITDTLAARLVLKKEESDGYMNNTFLNQDERQIDDQIGRLSLSWQASDILNLDLKIEHGESETLGRQYVYSIASDFAIGFHSRFDPNFSAEFGYDKSGANAASQSESDFQDSEWDFITLTAEWDIGEFSLKSITGYVDYEFDSYQDVDFGPAPFLGRARSEQHKQFTQEFLLSSPIGGTVEYLTGVYYQDEDLEHDKNTDFAVSVLGLPAVLDNTGVTDFQQDTTTWSAFAQLTWNVSDTVRIIGGLRYSNDEKEFEKSAYTAELFGLTPNPIAAGFNDSQSIGNDHVFNSAGAMRCSGPGNACTTFPDFDNNRKEEHWTGDVTVQWDVSDTVMSYLKVGNGYKAGGFDEDNARGLIEAQEFEDESVQSIEIGAKMDLWDSRARLNVAVFYNEFEDLQVSTFDGAAGFVVGNAAEAKSEGLEADAVVLLAESLTLKASFAYLDASYDSFPGAACTAQQIETSAGGDCVQDLTGAPLQFSPEVSANLALDYFTPLTDQLELQMGIDYMYSDEFEVENDQDPLTTQGSFDKINARIALAGNDGLWSVAILGKNLTDEKTSFFGGDVPLGGIGFRGSYFQFIEAPRSFEIQAQYQF